MKKAEKYIAKSVLSAIGLVTLTLIILEVFILFVAQLQKLGQGDYHVWAVMQVVLLQMPYEVYLFFPMASLLGCLIGLGFLAQHRELIVLRAAGVSVGQMTVSVFKIALWVILIVTVLGEYIIPYALQQSNDLKITAISKGQATRSPKEMWFRSRTDFIHVNALLPNRHLSHVDQFEFDQSHQLILVRHAKELYFEKGQWWMEGVDETRLFAHSTKAQQIAKMRVSLDLNPHVLLMTTVPDEMNLIDLYYYWRELQMHHQNAHHEQWVFWQRLMQPFSTLVMMLLAIPFIFGPLRSSTMGVKLLIGSTVGLGFYMVNRLIGSMSLLYLWDPMLVTMIPTLLFFILGIYLMRRAL